MPKLIDANWRTAIDPSTLTLTNALDREHVEGFEKIEIHAPKPVTVFRSSGARNRSTRNRPRSRWA